MAERARPPRPPPPAWAGLPPPRRGCQRPWGLNFLTHTTSQSLSRTSRFLEPSPQIWFFFSFITPCAKVRFPPNHFG